MSMVLDLAGNFLRASGNVNSRRRLTCRSWFARSLRAVAFFTMLFVSIASGEVLATNGLPRQPVSLFIHGSGIHKVSNDQSPISYFSDRMPDDADLPRAPDGATGVVVARVRLREASVYLGGRDQSGEAPKDQPKDIFFTRIKISDVLRGDASAGQTLDVRFGQRGDKRRLIYPYTPDQRDREYIVVMYVDASDGRRRLAPFPITEFQYSQWEIEQSAYTRLRGKAGSRE
ncbi:hypothetical protein [Bradyrhizobium sp. CB3481]|uniref:hypothetical protein n=1 Tax=Bradyrhizobium sp. CB3481 TaxID=3039158 RepID=UPI0024B23F3B|nr:hypothetical protein [Bradyrhizobium sp. CB3481]WFU15577.1 hypothetical protein QA643_32100 [Bradyrhizobium sp. CB3481]